MDVNTKVKELEDELKVLKTEIRNVLLDVREVILDKANPLSEQEPAYLRVDLKTTAQTIAAEEAARVAGDAAEEAGRRAKAKAPEVVKDPEQDEDELAQGEEPEASDAFDLLPEEVPEAEAQDLEEEQAEGDAPAEEETGEDPVEDGLGAPGDEGLAEPDLPKAGPPPRSERLYQAKLGPAEVSDAYRFYPPVAVGTGSLAVWVAEAMAAIGPQQLDRVITIHRLWGYLPPNISQALAHLQELIRGSHEMEPPWLKIMQDMEGLSSS
jgi:hypothetical protein